ncbi:uncharacterized protein EV422DRAFT_393983 [Fimicolochytrium jonesii]|uniref:uncharacterized protein n=1 Tax=Fimicolochytrium jonesii TaxID=1396493 RepID=UPI0022FDF045|nr:uncharacterized protein EV422DRAFT_393983 [Fimicolochytrium jonesii]KAI8823150.1 hypothetical protein EV422DRAFT_393983 [Fimicolochytrium jonesii]
MASYRSLPGRLSTILVAWCVVDAKPLRSLDIPRAFRLSPSEGERISPERGPRSCESRFGVCFPRRQRVRPVFADPPGRRPSETYICPSMSLCSLLNRKHSILNRASPKMWNADQTATLSMTTIVDGGRMGIIDRGRETRFCRRSATPETIISSQHRPRSPSSSPVVF